MPPPTKSAFLASLTATVPGDCHICYLPMASPYKTPCNHTFCRECATAWFEQFASCPTCRTTLYSPLLPGGAPNLLPEGATTVDISNALEFLAGVVKRLYDETKLQENQIEEYKKVVEEFKELALDWQEGTQEQTEIVEMYKEREEGWEELVRLLRVKIRILEERDASATLSTYERLVGEVEETLDLREGEITDCQDGIREASQGAGLGHVDSRAMRRCTAEMGEQ